MRSPTTPSSNLMTHLRPSLEQLYEKGGYDRIDEVQAIIQQTGALQYTEKMAQLQAQLAIAELAHLPDSENKTVLENIARLSVYRSH